MAILNFHFEKADEAIFAGPGRFLARHTSKNSQIQQRLSVYPSLLPSSVHPWCLIHTQPAHTCREDFKGYIVFLCPPLVFSSIFPANDCWWCFKISEKWCRDLFLLTVSPCIRPYCESKSSAFIIVYRDIWLTNIKQGRILLKPNKAKVFT